MALELGELATVLKANLAPFERDLRKAKQKFAQHGGQMRASALAAGAAIGAALGAGLLSAVEQSKTTALLRAQLGAGTPLAAQAGKAAGAVYARGVVGSMEEASTAVKAALQNALIPPGSSMTAIDAVAAKVANLSTVMQQDAGKVSTAVSQMIRTGMVKSAQDGFDLLQRGVEQGIDKSEDLLDTFNEYGTQFRKIGLDGPAAMGLLNQGLRAGARDADTVADALKEFAIRAVDGSKASATAYQALGLDAEKMTAQIARGGKAASDGLQTVLGRLKAMKDPVAREAAAVGLFGTKAEDLGKSLYALDPSTATASLGRLAGASDRAGRSLERSAGAKMEKFKRQAQQAFVTTMAQAIPYLEKITGFLSKHSEVVGPLTVGLGALALVIGTVAAAMKVWAVVQAVLNLELWTSPITWIVLGIVVLVAIIVLIAMKMDWFGKAWAATWDFVTSAFKLWWSVFSGFWTAIGGFFVGLFKAWWGLFTGFWSSVFSGISAGWKWVTGKVSALVSFVGSLPGRIKRALSGLASILSAPFRAGFNSISRLWNGTVGRLSFRMPGWVPGMGGKGFSMPHLPQLARGGTALAPGLAIVGEAGPELAYLGRGATVAPLSGSGSAAGANGRQELRLSGEFRIRGSDLILSLRDTVSARGGDVQAVIGSA